MGMAASQARYLALTARKTNVEYEGQQVNQARTALANQSANTFNDLLALEVPTAPSTNDYTTVQYSYEDGTIGETITDMTPLYDDPDYNYMVTHYHYSDVFTGVQSMKTNPQVVMGVDPVRNTVDRANITQDAATGTYLVNGQQVQDYNPLDNVQSDSLNQIYEEYPEFEDVAPGDIGYYLDADNNMHFLDKTQLNGTENMFDYHVESEVPTYVGNCELDSYTELINDPDVNYEDLKEAVEQIREDFPNSTFAQAADEDIYTWEYQGKRYFACRDDLYASAISGPDPTLPTENQDKLTYYNAQDVKTKIERTEKAFVDFDDQGRAETIRFEDSSLTFSLNTETITDEAAYQDAMNQYNYERDVYEKAIEDINAKTKQIQEQDRTLELRLRQLDTEQQALQTEMEAVAKVIEKNIESTFKTFE